MAIASITLRQVSATDRTVPHRPDFATLLRSVASYLTAGPLDASRVADTSALLREGRDLHHLDLSRRR